MTEPTPNPAVRVEQRGDVLWLIIDRASRRNALNAEVIASLEAGVALAARATDLRALVLTGAGDTAFCAGADLKQGTEVFGPEGLAEPSTDFGRLARRMRELGLPSIARINGSCVAGGMALMSLCDLAIAAPHARFGLPEVRVGVFPMQVLVFLRRTVHARHLNELCLTGELIDAERAAAIGLINSVAPAEGLDAAVDSVLARLRLASPVALKRGKAVIAAMEALSFADALVLAEAQIALAARTEDAREGMMAFTQKRAPQWTRSAEDAS